MFPNSFSEYGPVFVNIRAGDYYPSYVQDKILLWAKRLISWSTDRYRLSVLIEDFFVAPFSSPVLELSLQDSGLNSEHTITWQGYQNEQVNLFGTKIFRKCKETQERRVFVKVFRIHWIIIRWWHGSSWYGVRYL